jgi:3-methyladenine DNA glycosylase AlkD
LALAKSGDWPKRFLAYEILLHHPAARALVDADVARALAGRLSDWPEVDTFACYVAGPAWRTKRIATQTIREWAASPDRWWRRTAVVCTVPLNNEARGGAGDAKRTLDICARIATDRDDMVVKALSWALRELSKRDPAGVADFLAEHRDRLAPRVLREVGNKITTGLKNPSVARPQARAR